MSDLSFRELSVSFLPLASLRQQIPLCPQLLTWGELESLWLRQDFVCFLNFLVIPCKLCFCNPPSDPPNHAHHSQQGYGIATYPDTKVTPSTLYYTGSTTKAFTAAAMSLLVDDNANYSNVQWETPIIKLIPEDFMLSDEWATNHITIEDALSHRSGLPRHDYSYGGNYEGKTPSLQAAVRAIRYLPLTAQPRTKFQYCNIMYGVASHIIQTLTGKWLGDVLRERIWEPLGMKATVSQD